MPVLLSGGWGSRFWPASRELRRGQPLLAGHRVDALVENPDAVRREGLDFMRIDAEAFAACRSESTDDAVHRAAVVPLDPCWSDMGAWDAISELKSDLASQGNATRGDVMLHDTRNNLVHSHPRLVATPSIENLVVAGTARVTLGDGQGDSEFLRSVSRSEGESTYISLGTVHRRENAGVIPLKLIEVQTGSYLGENDNVHFDDATSEPSNPDRAAKVTFA